MEIGLYVQESQCGFNTYGNQAHDIRLRCYTDTSLQDSNVHSEVTFDCIYVLSGYTSIVGTKTYHLVDFLAIWNDYGTMFQHLMYICPTTGSAGGPIQAHPQFS